MWDRFLHISLINPLSLSKNTDRSPLNLSLVLKKQSEWSAQKFFNTIRFIPAKTKGFTTKAAVSAYPSHQKYMIKVKITENESASTSRKDQTRRSKHDKLLMRCRIHQISALRHQKYEKSLDKNLASHSSFLTTYQEHLTT